MAKRKTGKSKARPVPPGRQSSGWRTLLNLQTIKEGGFTISFTLLTLLVALTFSWVVMAKQNFWYGIWHDYTGIGTGIDTYGPLNRFKPGFGDTTRDQRIQLFAEINTAVHHGGDGLEAIRYHTLTSGGAQQMLREPEVVHLQDVANLIDLLFWVGFVSVILWLGVSAYLILVLNRLPGARQQALGLAVIVVPAVILVLVLGPELVFNTLHEWIFPDGHQWFFYYQESLMSTLMLAPRLFGWIAIALLLLAVLWFVLLQYGLQKLLRLLTR